MYRNFETPKTNHISYYSMLVKLPENENALSAGGNAGFHLPPCHPTYTQGGSGVGPLKSLFNENVLSAARSAVSRPFPAVIASRIHLSFQAMALRVPASN